MSSTRKTVTSGSKDFWAVNLLKNFIIRANTINNVNTVAQIILNGLGKADVLMQHASWAATEKSMPVALSSSPKRTAKPTMVIR